MVRNWQPPPSNMPHRAFDTTRVCRVSLLRLSEVDIKDLINEEGRDERVRKGAERQRAKYKKLGIFKEKRKRWNRTYYLKKKLKAKGQPARPACASNQGRRNKKRKGCPAELEKAALEYSTNAYEKHYRKTKSANTEAATDAVPTEAPVVKGTPGVPPAPALPPATTNPPHPVRVSHRQKSRTAQREEYEADLKKAILAEHIDCLRVQNIAGKGRGVITRQPFKKGKFVLEYSGELLSLKAAKKQEAMYSADPKYGCYMYYFRYKERPYCLDATVESGKLGRLVNHSSKGPNCETKVVEINGQPRLILIAACDIEAGVELLYDYGDHTKEALAAHPWLAL